MFTCHKDPEGVKCVKEKVDKNKSTEVEKWLNMMNSMLNFAMASTSLMKSIQNRVDVTNKLERESKAMRATEFSRMKFAGSMPEDDDASEDFSLKSGPIREDTCGEHTCMLLFRKKDEEECAPNCVSSGRKKIPPPSTKKKKKPLQESMDTIGDSCVCLIEPEEDICPSIQLEPAEKEPSCVCSEDEPEKEENEEIPPEEPEVICDLKVICPALASLDDYIGSEDCICPSLEIKEVNQEGPEGNDLPEELPEVESSVLDCGCQTTSSQALMIQELQFANLAYQMRQTDKNLKELKKEMERISTFVDGKRKCPYAQAAALYEEIMKPRTFLEESPRSNSRRRKK